MQFTGKAWKDKKHWLAEAPALDLTTQGSSRIDAIARIVDALEELVDRQSFRAKAIHDTQDTFLLTGNDSKTLLSVLLKRQREKAGLTISQAADRLGSSSPNSRAAYEQGARVPTTEKLEDLLEVLGPKATKLRLA